MSLVPQKLQRYIKFIGFIVKYWNNNVVHHAVITAKSLPERINSILERLANNELEIKIDAIDEKRFTDGFQKVANRITLGVIIVAMIIGAAMLMREYQLLSPSSVIRDWLSSCSWRQP